MPLTTSSLGGMVEPTTPTTWHLRITSVPVLSVGYGATNGVERGCSRLAIAVETGGNDVRPP